MSPAQCKAARQLLGWGRHKLAAKSRVPVHVIRRFEVSGHVSPPTSLMPQFDRATAIRIALEAAGVEFIDGEQPDVKLGLSLG